METAQRKVATRRRIGILYGHAALLYQTSITQRYPALPSVTEHDVALQ